MRRITRLCLGTGLLLSGCETGVPPLLDLPPEPAWIWENPRPFGFRLTAVRTAADGTLFAVGFSGAMLRDRGSGWEVIATPFTDTLLDLWVFGPEHVLVVGAAGRISEWRGGNWSHHTGLTTRALGGVWSDGTTTVVVGDAGTRLVHRDNGWTSVDDDITLDLEKVWGRDSSRLWAVSTQGRIRADDGTGWRVEHLVVGELLAVWGAGDEVFASGADRLAPVVLRRVDGVWGQSHVSSGVGWFASLTGAAADDVVAVRFDGTVARFDGVLWREEVVSIRDAYHQFTGVVGVGDDLVLTADHGGIYRGGGGTWTRETPVLAAGAILRAVWEGDGALWAVGNGPVLTFDGSNWRLDRVVSEQLYAGWGSATRNWAVGAGGGVVVWAGGIWSTERAFGSLEDDLRAAWEFPDGTRMAVGDRGLVLRDVGGGWVMVEEGNVQGTSWRAVWGLGGEEAFVAGEEGKMRRYRGAQWEEVPPITIADLRAMWGTGPGHVLAVGALGAILRFDGEFWRHEALGITDETDHFTAVGGRAEDDVYALTDDGRVFHYDGVTWGLDPGARGNGFAGSFVDGDGTVWTVGTGAMILRHGPPRP